MSQRTQGTAAPGGAAQGGRPAGAPLSAVSAAAGVRAALHAARRLGVLDRLAATPCSPEHLAADLGLDPRLTGAVLEVLAAWGLADVDARGAYRVTQGTATAATLAEQVYDALPGAWQQTVPAPRYDEPPGAGAHYPALVGLLADRMAPAADDFAACLARPDQRVLDVGAGAAPWSLAVARREPSCHVTALDLPEVIDTTRQMVGAAGFAGRYEFAGVDMFTHLPDASYDLVLLGSVCHLFDAETVQRLIADFASVLAPGGWLAVIDGVRDDPGTPATERTTYELGLALRTAGGRLHARTDYHRWMTAAGLRCEEARVSVRSDERPRMHLLRGRRSRQASAAA